VRPHVANEGEYVTDVLAEKAYRLLDDAVAAANPFFLTIAPSAPHADIQMSGSILDPDPVFVFDAPVSAKRHEHLFEDVVVLRGKNFNPDHVRRNVSIGRGPLLTWIAIRRQLGSRARAAKQDQCRLE
jgi:hypothetical protein